MRSQGVQTRCVIFGCNYCREAVMKTSLLRLPRRNSVATSSKRPAEPETPSSGQYPRRRFLHLAAGLPRSRPCRGSRGRKPIRRAPSP